eukprot:CAMPEP_0195512628 /NCGR_PEP_ID=MMETSP0794_2-20130614/4520_1 /TAXON_ID=515487 /ORGANISM="Stephanopyxis turris, Strain CCMP 815" /LENGTH=551 /DNA_ID=CAMNT_0040640457 /DNA_START=172 /DNA_END=1827 /DNA_ORIENTATION=+
MLTNQPWIQTGELNSDNPWVAVSSNPDVLVDRISCILERLLAKVVRRRVRVKQATSVPPATSSKSSERGRANVLQNLSFGVRAQLRLFVSRIAIMYRDVHFHSFEHAYHVTISANQLINMMLTGGIKRHIGATNMTRKQVTTLKHFSTFGISSDPISHFTLVFAALVHDVEHRGITNRQLVSESHPLAIRYNDQSVAEQNSLSVTFTLLTEPPFSELRSAIFQTPEEGHKFRQMLISLIMATDIANPERVQLGKSKWKEAFKNSQVVGDAIEMRVDQMSPTSIPIFGETTTIEGGLVGRQDRRGSTCSTSSAMTGSTSRRDSLCSISTTTTGSTSRSMCSTTSEFSFHIEDFSQEIPSLETDRQERRHSCCLSSRPNNELTLGIKRTLTLHGSTIEFYTNDEDDKLKASTVLDQVMQVADVAHTMQSFDVFKKWNHRLYEELYVASQLGRGDNVGPGWYENQITFFDSYIIPLTKRLKQSGVMGEFSDTFLQCANENRRLWIIEGREFSGWMKAVTRDKWMSNFLQEEEKMKDVTVTQPRKRSTGENALVA